MGQLQRNMVNAILAFGKSHLQVKACAMPKCFCHPAFRPGAAYAVNCIQLTAEQLRNKCRQRIWYPMLRDCLIFRDQRSKDEYLLGVQRKRYQLLRCIDLENYDITEKSANQLSGISTSSKQVVSNSDCKIQGSVRVVDLERDYSRRGFTFEMNG